MKEVKPQAVTLPAIPTGWDQGAGGPANQIGLRTEPATDFDHETGKEALNPNGVKRRRRDDWVARYRRAGHLTAKQAADAIKLRMAAEAMRERDPLEAIYSDRRPGQSDPEAARVDARAYFRELWAKVPQASRPIMERVVLEDQPVWHGNAAQREHHMLRLLAGPDAIS